MTVITQNRNLDVSLLKHGTRLRERLAKTRGFSLSGSHTGELEAGPYSAAAQLEPDGSIRVTLPAPLAASARKALQANAELDGNVRFAIHRGDMTLVAETQLDGELHLSESFEAIRSGLLTAMGEKCRRARRSDRPIDIDTLRHAIHELPWESDAVVQQADGWELRPTIAGEPVRVSLSANGPAVRLRRVLMKCLPDGIAGEAIAHESLRCNWVLRRARLAIADGQLVAETRLHSGLVNGSWLSLATRAVGMAARHVEAKLCLLRDEPVVHQLYAEVFCH